MNWMRACLCVCVRRSREICSIRDRRVQCQWTGKIFLSFFMRREMRRRDIKKEHIFRLAMERARITSGDNNKSSSEMNIFCVRNANRVWKLWFVSRWAHTAQREREREPDTNEQTITHFRQRVRSHLAPPCSRALRTANCFRGTDSWSLCHFDFGPVCWPRWIHFYLSLFFGIVKHTRFGHISRAVCISLSTCISI